ncbi:MAG: serine--tRNA ligase [Cucumibacter sp.]
MFDIKWIRDNPEKFDIALRRRGLKPQSADLLKLDKTRRAATLAMNAAQEKQNAASKQIGQARAQKEGARAKALLTEVGGLKAEVQAREAEAGRAEDSLNAAMAVLPNMLRDDVPDGKVVSANVERGRHGEKRKFNFKPKEHDALGVALSLMDFEAAARMSGARFVVLRGQLARLERALGQFMLDLHVSEHGFTEHQTPLLVADKALFGSGQLPKFAEDAFETKDGRWLIPTSEVTLANLVRESILDEKDLPKRFTALTPCFRAEAGATGKDTSGMIRQHQFNKVELVAVTRPEDSDAEQEHILACAEEVLKRLGLHYRVVRLCAGDMGATMQRTFDIEVWLPGQGAYREISSVSTAGDWQARRMNARFRRADGKPEFVHTLNGSGVAVGRALIAVMETFQNEDGSISVPGALAPYMGGITEIGPAH